MQHGKKVAVALGCIGATRQMPARISSAHVEAQHRITRCSKGDTKPAHAFATTGSTEPMQHNHQRLRSWWTIQEGEQGSRTRRTAAQGRHLNL